MKLSDILLILPFTLGSAFVQQSVAPRCNRLILQSRHDGEDTSVTFWRQNVDSIKQEATKSLATAFVAATLWASPTSLLGLYEQHATTTHNIPFASTVVASAKEMASASGSRVNKDPESLLRYGLPINNKEVRKLQVSIESIKTNIGSKRKQAAIDDVKAARIKINNPSKLTSSCRDANVCTDILSKMGESLGPLENALSDSKDAFQGSEQERSALDKAYKTQDSLQKQLTALEEQMVPAGYKTPVPDDYKDLPQLEGGRATVEMKFKKTDGGPFRVNGENFKDAKMTMVIDGFTSPVTSGNFVDLVKRGFYDNMKIQRSDGFVVQTGDPDGEAEGFVGTPSKSIGAGKHGERLIPSEIFVVGDKGPFYETTIEDEGRGGQATVLPFSSYGAMGWAREEYDANSGSSQFFWLLFDSDLTPAGKNVLDGRYPCFGYVVEGADFLSDLKEEDIIVSAKVTSGLEFLKRDRKSVV